MLRNTLIILGLLVALDPYLGFPQAIDKFILTTLGLLIFFLLAFSRRTRQDREVDSNEEIDKTPKILRVERIEVVDTPKIHIENNIAVETASIMDNNGEETLIEKKTTVIHRRRKRIMESQPATPTPDEQSY